MEADAFSKSLDGRKGCELPLFLKKKADAFSKSLGGREGCELPLASHYITLVKLV
jgi:hypothetical protein